MASSSYSAPASSFSSWSYDVFLSFRGEDTRKTFVDHLYSALNQRLIRTYKDDKTLPRGESIGPSLFKAIEESKIAVIIFSENYADSSWCLEELAHIMKCKDERDLIVMPVFYDVDPSDVRKQKRKFGEAFAKHEVESITKAESWRKALVDASKIAGWEPKNIANGHESTVIKRIVDTILDRLLSSTSEFDEDLIGMEARLQDLKTRLEVGSGGVRMVGIWGVGGGGKTTLANYAYMEISRHFEGHCIVENIREESHKYGLKKLQENILSAIFKTKVEVNSITEGKSKLKRMLCHSSVLILLDDVDDADQLEVLAGSHSWFGSGSRIMITTRDEHLLRTHKVDEVYRVRLLSNEEAIQLFNKRAYNKKKPVKDYEILSSSMVSYAAGLPLALKLLGSFLYDKDKREWMSTLARLKDIPETKILEQLKISYDGLETMEKRLFLDIACFFRGKSAKYNDDAIEILEACGLHPDIGITILRQKALINIVDSKFDMHDLVQEMGHYIVRGEHPNNPEKHSRVWKQEEINDMCLGDATMVNHKIEAIMYHARERHVGLNLSNIVSNMKKLRWLSLSTHHDEFVEGPNFLSNELRYIHWGSYPASPFPTNFQPLMLVVLRMHYSFQKELWKGYTRLPHLKVLELMYMKKLLRTPDFDGLQCLQKLTICGCLELEEIHPSLGNHRCLEYINVSNCIKLKKFPTIVHMEKLETLEINGCQAMLEFPKIQTNMGSLVNLYLGRNGIEVLPSSIGVRCTYLLSLHLVDCFNLKGIDFNFHALKHLKEFKYDGVRLLESMLQGNSIENHSMVLRLQGIEIAKGFSPPLLRGSRCRLQLPENWSIDFSGLVFCAVVIDDFDLIPSLISMKHLVSGIVSEDDVVWEASDMDGDKYTLVWYVSFGSLRHTTWWDETKNAVSLSIDSTYNGDSYSIDNPILCSGFGVRLVGGSETSTFQEESEFSHYTPIVDILQDSQYALHIWFKSTYDDIN
ncbi:hypothetical protein L1987_53516 [Smallanthus sonchifolius]|uniref:Uncharacterized protein n=1 Tax=Smallanthus sonchifolius TaxID=185202 RepID=A0ACB9EWH3_9ASTR|nr:hypothetical protein L1987_53516 [Smallanthus sonchifolius]